MKQGREIIVLECKECKMRNYTDTKNKKKHPEKAEYKKYCPKCRKHVVHKQTK
ncbi:MAG: 50S ribosomal protein L33 [Candidatus Coatesbacteria bacterium]|nr:50S ribosomal protein L33 [Candidatus Coatesbacteria bacterium]